MLPASDVRWNECGWVANRWCELLPLDTDLQLQLLEQPAPCCGWSWSPMRWSALALCDTHKNSSLRLFCKQLKVISI